MLMYGSLEPLPMAPQWNQMNAVYTSSFGSEGSGGSAPVTTRVCSRVRGKPPNKSLQRTFDPPPIFAAAKTGVASNAAEPRR